MYWPFQGLVNKYSTSAWTKMVRKTRLCEKPAFFWRIDCVLSILDIVYEQPFLAVVMTSTLAVRILSVVIIKWLVNCEFEWNEIVIFSVEVTYLIWQKIAFVLLQYRFAKWQFFSGCIIPKEASVFYITGGICEFSFI